VQFTSAQQATFRTWLTTNAAGLSDQAAADLANTPASPAYSVWDPAKLRGLLDAAVNKANYTPTDAPPASGSTQQVTNDQLLFNNRALACQLKQANAQWLTGGNSGDTVDCRTASLRQNFKDCMTAIPSGAGGANQDAGWGTVNTPGAVRLAMMLPVSNVGKLFVSAAAGPGNDGVSGNRGTTTNPDLPGLDARGLPMLDAVTSGQVAEARG
jgi:hypothetical protein